MIMEVLNVFFDVVIVLVGIGVLIVLMLCLVALDSYVKARPLLKRMNEFYKIKKRVMTSNGVGEVSYKGKYYNVYAQSYEQKKAKLLEICEDILGIYHTSYSSKNNFLVENDISYIKNYYCETKIEDG